MRWNAILMLAAIAAIAVSPAHAVEESQRLQLMDRSMKDSNAASAMIGALFSKARSSCEFREGSTQYSYFDVGINAPRLVTYTLKVKKWTGGCVDGKRDGKGTFRASGKTDLPGAEGYETESEGTLVAGVPVGLWCIPVIETGNRRATNCSIGDVAASFRKDEDGRWHIAPDDTGTAVELPAGSLEAESDRLIAAARAGVPAERPNISATVPALFNLTQGASIRLGAKPPTGGLRGKRIAVVYSDATLASIKQFPLDVQAALAASSVPSEQNTGLRSDFLATATAQRFTQSIGAPLLRKGISVVPADDLSVLAKGQADYVLLVDWRYTWHSNLTEVDYDTMPVCEIAGKKPCEPIYKQSVSLYLIGPGPELLASMPIHDSLEKLDESNSENDLIKSLDFHFGGVMGFGLFDPTSGSVATGAGTFVDGF